MEVTRGRLHRHALLLAAVFFSLSVLSGLATASVMSKTSDDKTNILTKSAFTRVLHVRPSANGWAKFSVNEPSPSLKNADFQGVGQSAQMSIILNSSSR